MTRRRFLRTCGAGLAVAAPLAALGGCTSQDAENFAKAFGELPKLINDYRDANGLDKIPLSPALTAVAMKHVIDLISYQPEKNCGGNLHSWSNNGPWKGGCFDLNNSSTHPIMWGKPKEIAQYPDSGYEIAYWSASTATPQGALLKWQGGPHNDVILNKGATWGPKTWKALGAVVGGNYACAWFGVVEQ
jgi:hypothetical protein